MSNQSVSQNFFEYYFLNYFGAAIHALGIIPGIQTYTGARNKNYRIYLFSAVSNEMLQRVSL